MRIYKTVVVLYVWAIENAAQDPTSSQPPETSEFDPPTTSQSVSLTTESTTTQSYQLSDNDTAAFNVDGLIGQSLRAGDRLPFLRNTRRIISGHESGSTKPYMVYLRAAPGNHRVPKSWLCGGAIVHALHILTSAACIEDVDHFFVVSGTHRYIPPDTDDECIAYGAKRAVWKCTPKTYVFDGDELDNIRWLASDIAVVRVEDAFNFERRVRGCDFVPGSIGYNNQTAALEKPWVFGTVAGWGSTETFSEDDPLATEPPPTSTDPATGSAGPGPEPGTTPGLRTQVALNSESLLETEVVIIPKANCRRLWPERYHYIISDSMICSQDAVSNDISVACLEQGLVCKEIIYDERAPDAPDGRRALAPDFDAEREANARRGFQAGGFCENDHGGPLVVGQGRGARVVGIISACMVKDASRKCYGPFLYTSVWRHRHLIDCAINKEIAASCRRLLRSGSVNEQALLWPEDLGLRRGNETGLYRAMKKEVESPRSSTRPAPTPVATAARPALRRRPKKTTTRPPASDKPKT